MLDSETENATREALRVIFPQIQKLIKLGWRAPHIGDRSKELLMIEAESTGIHSGYCDDEGSYWVTSDGDCSPTHPLLVRPLK